MPRPLKPPYMGGGVCLDILLRQPELGALIATISHGWAMIEMHLADLMDFISGKGALSIYLSLVSLDMKIKALQTVIKESLPDEMHKEFRDIIHKELKKRAQERNKIAHARWAENGHFPNAIIMLPHFGDVFSNKKPVALYEAKDFIDIIRRISATENIVREFCQRAYAFQRESTSSNKKGF